MTPPRSRSARNAVWVRVLRYASESRQCRPPPMKTPLARSNEVDEGFGIGDTSIASVQDLYVPRARSLQILKILPVIPRPVSLRGRRDQKDRGVGSAGDGDELFQDRLTLGAAADDHQRPPRWAELRRGQLVAIEDVRCALRPTLTCPATESSCLCASLLLQYARPEGRACRTGRRTLAERGEDAVHSRQARLQILRLVAESDPQEAIHAELITGNDEETLLVPQSLDQASGIDGPRVPRVGHRAGTGRHQTEAAVVAAHPLGREQAGWR